MSTPTRPGLWVCPFCPRRLSPRRSPIRHLEKHHDLPRMAAVVAAGPSGVV